MMIMMMTMTMQVDDDDADDDYDEGPVYVGILLKKASYVTNNPYLLQFLCGPSPDGP